MIWFRYAWAAWCTWYFQRAMLALQEKGQWHTPQWAEAWQLHQRARRRVQSIEAELNGTGRARHRKRPHN